MQEDQPMSLAQFFRETYLSETRSRHRHGQSRCSDIHEKTPQKTHFSDPDLSAFLSQEELDKSVDLACKAITDDQDERSDGRHYSVFTSRVTPGTEIISEMKTNLQGKGISKEMDGWHVGVSSREPATETETMLEMPNPVQENPSRKEHRDWDGQHFSTEEMSEKLKVQASRMENTTMMDNHEANECCSNDCSNIIPEQIEVMSGTPIVQQQKANEFTNTFNQINEKTEIRPEMPQTQPLLPQDCNEECDGNHFSLASVGKLTPETEIQPLMQDTIRYGQKEQANGHHFSSSSRKLKSESELLSETQIHQPSLLENAIRNARASRETGQDFRKAQRNPPYGLETQSKKEFLNKAADFIEELSSLFKANSSRRIQPRACKAHRSRYQNKTQPEISAEDRERPVIINPEVKEPIDVRPIISEDLQDPEPLCETLNMIQVQSSEEPVCDRPHFVLKLKSREVQEGSKVQLDCIVRGTPAPEVRWFCEGKELENSPDVQILSSGEHHSLIIAEAFEEDTGRYSCFASNLYGSDSTSAEIYIEGASSSDSDVEQNFQAQFHKRSLQPKPTVNQTSSEDSKSPETSPCSEPSAPSLALAEHVIKPITEYQQEPENSQTLNPEIPQIKITEPLEPEPEETTLLSEGEDGAPPSGQSFSEELLTSQLGLSETFNGSSSSCVQSLDMRPMMEAPVFTKRLQDVLALESQLVVLECRVKGIPSPKVDWYREGMLIEDSPDFRILQKKPRSMAESEEICTLVIAEVFPEDSGTFNCTASNRYGTVSSTAVLTVKGHTNTSTNHENLNPLQLESSAPKFPSIDLKSSSLKRKPEIPTINSKLYSSMISLDPLSSIYKQTDTSDGANSRSDFLNSTAARHDMTTSLPSLDPLSIGKYSSDIFKSRLPTVDSLGFNGSSLSSNSSQSDPCSRFQTLSDSQFDSGGSSFQGSVNVTKNKPNGSVLNISLSSETEPEESRTICIPSVTSSPFVSSNNLQEQVPSKPLPDPPTSCLKTRPERVLGNHNRSRSSSRVGLRVTFKLPEEEEDEEEEEEKGFLSKEPPPVLAKPKLDPAQLQILHNQVLLEQHQDNVSPGQEPSKSDKTNCSDQPTIPSHVTSNLTSSSPPKPPVSLINPTNVPSSIPLDNTASSSILKPTPLSQISMALPSYASLTQLSPLNLQSLPTFQNTPSTLKNNDLKILSASNSQAISSQNMTITPSVKPEISVTQALVAPNMPQLKSAATTSFHQSILTPSAPINPHQPIVVPIMVQTISSNVTPNPNLNPTMPMSQNLGAPGFSQSNSGPSTSLPQTIMVPSTQLNPNQTISSTAAPVQSVKPRIPLMQTLGVSNLPQSDIGAFTSFTQTVINSSTQFVPSQSHMGQAEPLNGVLVIPTVPITQTVGSLNIPNSNTRGSTSLTQTITTPFIIPNNPPFTSSTHIAQMNTNSSIPASTTPNINVLKKPESSTVNKVVSKLNSTPITNHNNNPQNTNTYSTLSNLTSPPLVRNKPAPSPMSPPPIIDTKPPFSSIVPSSTQSFNYARPKEFRSPSPTESPVPMLHELAAQLFPKSSRDLTSPVNQPGRRFPTRVLESPSSPPYVSSPPPLFSAGLMNSVFSFRPQSPPQAPSPTSSGSSPSPIQNPVAFLSSVLPSLPTAPATNAMGLPKRAPQGPQGTQKKVQRGSRIFSEEEIRNSKELLLLDMERKVQFKDDHLPLGQQEYKVSSFEQRLMSEIEFRLERTPVEESDDDVQHDEIPTGKCIAPIFDRKLKHFRAVEGIPVTFTCRVLGIPLPKVYWFKDGKQILKKNDHYQKIREGDGTCSLHIESVTSDDDGNYTVMAANPQGRISCSGHLIVQTGPVRNRPVVPSQRVRARVQEVEGEPTQQRFFRPHFLQAPGDTQAHEGKLCRLDCKVSGLPHPEIMWLLNGKPIYPDETHRLLVRENGVHSLLLDPLSQADDGTYTCIASNKAGQSSFCLQLTVLEKELKQAPRFLEKLQNCGLAEGAPARLECRVLGTPRPLIYWKKDNDTIPHSTDRVSMHQDSTGYVCLLIQPSRKDDAGWYTVSAKNEAGIVSCTARLDIYAQWHQHVHPPMRKAGMSGSRYAALSGLGLDVKSAFPSSENVPPVFSKESEEL